MAKPRLAIVSSHKICCALAYYADALKELLEPSFEVEILDLKTSELLRQEGKTYEKMSEAYLEQLCLRLQDFDLINVHLELGIFGNAEDLITSRILQICQASGRLILTVHTIDYKPHSSHTPIYQQIMQGLKSRPPSNPFHLIAHLPRESELLTKNFGFKNVSDFPLIFLTDKRRKHFQEKKNPALWKKQFGFQETDVTLGMFGLLSAHKNYSHALRTLNLLPSHYKLLIIGEAHHMNVRQGQIDPVVQEMISFLDSHPHLADRVFFTGRRDDEQYYEALANIDFVLLPSFEVYQSGSAVLSNALELSCAILKSNTYNSHEYGKYFPNCFEVFDIGNYYETKNKILNFDKNKIENLRKQIGSFSEIQLQQMYMQIYNSMKSSIPINLSTLKTSPNKLTTSKLKQSIVRNLSRSRRIKKIFQYLPQPIQSILRKLRLSLIAKN